MKRFSSHILSTLLFGLGISLPILSLAQPGSPNKDTTSLSLKPVRIDAIRMESTEARTPMAISIIDQSLIQQGNQQLSILESLDPVPGLVALNQENFAQDLRISIRGFGARAAFGIRGVKILVDGIPESTPDGQAQVDNIDMGVIQNIQVIRGPAAGLYGNAAGGVLLLQSEQAPERSMAEGRITFGSYNLQRYQFKTGFRSGKLNALIYGAHTRMDGYREHSEVENTLLNGRFEYTPDSSTRISLLLNYVDSPIANDPGGVDSTLFTDEPRQPRDRNRDFDAGESVRQGRIALIGKHQFSAKSSLQVRGYFLNRDFENKLPFAFGGAVNINRNYAGGGISYQYSSLIGSMPYRLQVGMDIDNQADDRTRFMNNEGVLGDLTFDQRESFLSIGTFAIQELYLTPQINVNLALRFDALRLEATDRFLGDGDESGNLSFDQLNPSLGIVYAPLDRLSLYSNVASSFETPTLSELSANPDGGGGFNPELEAQKAVNYEIGIKGNSGRQFQYTLALFYITVFDELVPYELAAFPDREFYRNAGQSGRAGAELAVQTQLTRHIDASASYTYGDFSYRDYESNGDRFDGNFLPGIPKHMAYAGIRYQHPNGFFTRIWTRHTGSMFANDQNTVETDPFTLVNFRAAWALELPWGIVEPFAGVNNLLNQQYSGNVRINAFGGRFYEGAAGTNVFGGIRVRLEKS